MISKYGLKFPDGTNDLTIELFCFKNKRPVSRGGLGTFGHLKEAIDLLWNDPKNPRTRQFIWSPWAEDFLREACKYDYLSVAGCASSGKSDTAAVWGIVKYLSSPSDTLVIMTSTTLREARRRIWKSTVELWCSVPGLPGKLVESMGCIKGISKNGDYVESTGITLVPCEKKQERKAIGKLIGIKQHNLVLIADELPELPESIIDAAYTNMDTNPNFSMIGLGNPNDVFDAFGIMAEPKDGWDSITENDYEWETDRGYCIRFDATKNPNLDRLDNKYFWMPSQKSIDQAREKYGENSLLYYRMYKGFWCPEGADDSIYSSADFLSGRAFDILALKYQVKTLASLDPSFTKGGDLCLMTIGELAEYDGRKVLQMLEQIGLQENINDTQTPRSHQISRQFRDKCLGFNILPYFTGCDSTGGGGPFLDVLHNEWSHEVLNVSFSGKASDRPVSADDPTKGHERYKNRMSEIWFGAVELLRSEQLKGLNRELAKEMSARKYDTLGDSAKLVVEPKKLFKARIGHSPDKSDSLFVLIDLCRSRFGLLGAERFGVNKERRVGWNDTVNNWSALNNESFLIDE